MEATRTKTKNMVLAALICAATAILAQIVLPIGPVPFNLAVFGAYLAGCLLSPLWAAASMGVYLLLGTFGVPVFAQFSAGPSVLFGPTGGYIFGYIAIALCTALAIKNTHNKLLIGGAMLLGLAVCYTLGTGWFIVATGRGVSESLLLCVVPFIVPDILKGVGAFLLAAALKSRLR